MYSNEISCGNRVKRPYVGGNMREIKTGRLHIRNFVMDDWRSLQDMIVWYMSSPYAAFDHQWPTSDDEIIGVCQGFASTDNFLVVQRNEDDRFIGYVSLNPTEDADVFDLGYCFNMPYHGQGYAYESCSALIDFAFHELKAEKIVAGTADNNIPSCKLLQKLGMKIVKHVTASFRNDENGRPIEFSGCAYELSSERI